MRVAGFDHIPGGEDIGMTGAHTVIDLHPAPAGNAAGADEIDQRLDTDGDQDHFAGETLASRGDDVGNLTVSPHDLSDLCPGAHIDAVPPLLLEHQVGCNRV